MITFKTIYLSGVAVSAVICLLLTLMKKELRISDIISVVLNIICSWATPLSLLGILLNNILNKTGNNKQIWKKSDNKQQARIIKTRR